MDKLCIVVWFVTLITFVVFFFKKRKARKAAGENYKQDEQYLKVSKKKKIIGWVCILSFIGSICFAPDHPKQELTPEQIQAQQAKKEEAKAKKEAEKAEKEAEAKAKKEAEDKAQQEEEAKKQAEANNPEKLCQDALGIYFKSIEVNHTEQGLVIHVYMSADRNNYTSMEKLQNEQNVLERYSMQKQVNKVMDALYKSNLNIVSVTTHTQGQVRDGEGNLKNNSDWIRCTVEAKTGKNRDWTYADGSFSNFDKVWMIDGLAD